MLDTELLQFLLEPGGDTSAIDQKVYTLARAELLALDAYLSEQAGSCWLHAKSRHGLELEGRDWRLLWPGRLAGRLLLSERERGNPSWQNVLTTDKSLERRTPADSPRQWEVVTSGSFIDLELSRSFHPSIKGSELVCEPVDETRFSSLAERYFLAAAMLDRNFPEGFSVFSKSVSSIVPLQVVPRLADGMCVSLSIAAAPGVVLLTMSPIILLSETLLHEAAHCRLSAAEDLLAIWKANEVRLQSPLRPDSRPIGGLFHQAYVLYWLPEYFRRLRDANNEQVLTKNKRQIEKRIAELEEGFWDAVSVLRENRAYLTDFGCNLLNEMAGRRALC